MNLEIKRSKIDYYFPYNFQDVYYEASFPFKRGIIKQDFEGYKGWEKSGHSYIQLPEDFIYKNPCCDEDELLAEVLQFQWMGFPRGNFFSEQSTGLTSNMNLYSESFFKVGYNLISLMII